MTLCDYCESKKTCRIRKHSECSLFTPCKREEYIITSEQIRRLEKKILDASPDADTYWRAIKELKEMFPDEFKPKQEYCCDIFREFVETHQFHPLVSKHAEKNEWLTDTHWTQSYCFNCGKKPIPPINPAS